MTPGTEQGVTVVRDDPVALARSLRNEPGSGEIWLFGGGVPLVAHLPERSKLSLIHTQTYPSGMVALHYRVLAAEGATG